MKRLPNLLTVDSGRANFPLHVVHRNFLYNPKKGKRRKLLSKSTSPLTVIITNPSSVLAHAKQKHLHKWSTSQCLNYIGSCCPLLAIIN